MLQSFNSTYQVFSMTYTNQKADPRLNSKKIPLADDYDGSVSAKVDFFELPEATTAVIYIHGYMDYFFQTHLSNFFIAKGISFYAVELRKYGSSLQAHHHENFCKDVREYYEEITAVIHQAKEAGHNNIILHGHSTGGLIATHYLLHAPDKALVTAAVLNSPFFAFNGSEAAKFLLSIVAPLGKFFPFLKVTKLPSLYTQSLHKDYKGRWDFDLNYKPIPSFYTYLGWMRGILKAQHEIYPHRIEIPALILHAERSSFKTTFSEEALRCDTVLNVKDITYYGEKIYKDLAIVSVDNAIHDIVLSSDPVIEHYFSEITHWLDKNSYLP